MDDQGLNDEEFKGALEEVKYCVNALQNDVPFYMIRGKKKYRQTPLEISLIMKDDVKRMVSILKDYDRR